MKELQVLLAQRLLAINDDSPEKVDKEVGYQVKSRGNNADGRSCLQRRNIEILKIRFGEAALQVCEVMLRDMTDSKRIDGHVQSQKHVRTVHPPVRGPSNLSRPSSPSSIRQLYPGISGLPSNRAI